MNTFIFITILVITSFSIGMQILATLADKDKTINWSKMNSIHLTNLISVLMFIFVGMIYGAN